MFSAERRAIATLFATYAGQGLRGAGLIAHVRDQRPDATWQDLMCAAFLAVTRRDADQATVPIIYDVALLLRKAHNTET